MATQPIKEGELDPQTRARAKKELHEANSKRRAEAIEQQKSDFQSAHENPVVIAILEQARKLSNLHLQMAKDGVGMRQTGERNEFGEPVSENIFFSKDKRMTELDKSAGIDELINWIERMLGTQVQPVLVKPTEIKENGPEEE